MNHYLIRIIDILCKKSGLVNKKDLIDELNINRSKFFYYLNELNQLLKDHNINEIYDDGISLQASNLQLKQMKKLSSKDTYYFSSAERKDFIVLILSISKSIVNYKTLESFLGVSRNTIIGDLNEIKKILKIEYSKDVGLYFVGDEFYIRYITYQSLFQNNNRIILAKKREFVEKQIELIVNKKIEVEDVEKILLSEKQHYFSTDNLSLAVIVSYIRSIKKTVNNLYIDIDDTCFIDIVKKLNELGLIYNKEEENYLYLLVQSTKVVLSKDQIKNETVLNFIDDFIDRFSRIYYINLKEYDIYHMLISHLYSLYYRSKYQIKIFDYSDIKINLEDNYGFNYLVNDIENKYSLSISDEERKILRCYFESLKMKDIKEKKENKIIIVCPAGLGSSSYIKYQLMRMFDNSFQIEIIDYPELERKIDNYTSLVVSTLNTEIPDYITNNNVDWINVPIVFKETDKKVLIDWLINNSDTESNNDIKNIINIIANNATIEDKNNLYFQLNKYLSNSYLNKSNKLYLLDLIAEKYINIFDQNYSLFEGIELTSKSLVADEIINEKYVSDIKETIKEYGLYCECFNGIIIPHARPHHNVKRPVISIGIFKKPIYVEDYNKEISAIFVLGVIDKESHIEAFSELIDFLKQEDRYKKIDKYNSAKELFEELKNYEGEKRWKK